MWVAGLVGPSDRDMTAKEVVVMPSIDLGDQANLGCIDRPDSLCRVMFVSNIGFFTNSNVCTTFLSAYCV